MWREPLCTVSTTTVENNMEVPWEVKNRTTTWSSNPTSGCLSKGYEITTPKR